MTYAKPKVCIDWWLAQDLLKKVYTQIKNSEFVPELIAPVDNYSIIPAALLRQKTNSTLVLPNNDDWYLGPTAFGIETKVLLIAAKCIYDRDLRNSELSLQSFGFKNVRSAALVLRKDIGFRPTYCGKEVVLCKDVGFFWEDFLKDE